MATEKQQLLYFVNAALDGTQSKEQVHEFMLKAAMHRVAMLPKPDLLAACTALRSELKIYAQHLGEEASRVVISYYGLDDVPMLGVMPATSCRSLFRTALM
jgi:hypothetical protein